MMRRYVALLLLLLLADAGAQAPRPPIDTLNGLRDVTIASPSNNEVLTYESSSSQWKNKPGGGGGGGSPGGASTTFQFNDGGSFGGVPSMKYDGTIPATITLTPATNIHADGLLLTNTANPATDETRFSPDLRLHAAFNVVAIDGTSDIRITNQGEKLIIAGQMAHPSYPAGYGNPKFYVNYDGDIGTIDGDATCTFAEFKCLDAMIMGNGTDIAAVDSSTFGVLRMAATPSFGNPRIVWSDSATYYSGTLDTAIGRAGVGQVGIYAGYNSSTLGGIRAAAIPNLTSNGFVKTSGGVGTLSIDTNTYLTGNQTITLSGDVTGSGATAIATTIANDAVTYAKMQNISAASKLLGRGSAGGAGDPEEITLGTNLSMSGTTLNATGGGGGSPGGDDRDVQVNDGIGGFLGTNDFEWDNAGKNLTLISGSDSFVWNAAGLGEGRITTTPASNTAEDGFIVRDTTAATSGNQQYSGAIRLTGQGWKTDATAASQPVDFRLYNKAIQGAANPSGQLTIESQINGGGYTEQMNLSSGGIMTLPSGGSLAFGTDTILKRNAAGVVEINNGTAGTFRDLKARSWYLQDASAPRGVRLFTSDTGAGDDATIQNTTDANRSTLRVMPKGSAANFPGVLEFFGTDFVADSTNFERLSIRAKGSGDTYYSILTDAGGTGTRRPIAITADNTATQLVLSTTGPITVGGTDVGLSRNAAGVLEINNGTAGQWAALKGGLRDATTSAVGIAETWSHNSTGTPANGLGIGTLYQLESSTTENTDAGEIDVSWTDVTHASRKAKFVFKLASSGSPASKLELYDTGGACLNCTSDPGAGILNANTGFNQAAAEFPIASNGIPKRTAARTWSAVTAPSGALVGDTDTQTLTNKRVNPRVTSITSNATWSPSADTDDTYKITAQAVAVTTISNPSGTPVDQQKLIITVKDDGTGRALTWSGTKWASTDVTLPTTTVAGKWSIFGFIYNSTADKWFIVAKVTEA